MNVDIFIVSHARDFRYLKYALRSIEKFARNFHGVHLVIPRRDVKALYGETEFRDIHRPEWHLHTFDEWHGKGFLHHMFLILNAEQFCFGADYILHIDSDCVFIENLTPEDYFTNGKPQLLYASFDWLCNTQQANLRMWQTAVEKALGWKPEHEIMRRHPAIHPPEVYVRTRQLVEAHTRQSLDAFMHDQRNEFPQTFAEFPTLGAVAWRDFHDRYHWINQETEPWPFNKLVQMWTHCEPTEENLGMLKKIGID